MDPEFEFEFEEIKETEVCKAACNAEYLQIARRAVARQNYWQMLG
jgi:hypothetical protein